MAFRGYGLPLVELVSEGNLGLMQAVKKFNPELGYRLATYAMWWIKASIQEYVLKSWSLVKIGTTAAQRKLFFNLRKLKRRLLNVESRDISDAEVNDIATQLNVSAQDVVEMNSRMAGGDFSLNNPVAIDSEEEAIDLLPETRPNQESSLAEKQEMDRRKALFNNAMLKLNERERFILTERRLKEKPSTLEDLSQLLNISRERVRQIEERIIEKLQLGVKEGLPS
jgi:RNA polymerase sigma-32 factor